MRLSKRGVVLLLTFLFSVAATWLPIPFPNTGWKPWVGTSLWETVVFFGYLFLESEFEPIRHLRKKANHYVVLTVVFLIFGGLGVGFFALFESKEEKKETRKESSTETHGPTPAATETVSQPVADIAREVHKLLRDDFIKSQPVDAAAKAAALQDKISELSEKHETLTKKENEILDEGSMTIDALERARKQHLETIEVEKQQQELIQQRASIEQQQADIERQNQKKRAQEEYESRQKEFSKQYIPIVDYAITTLYLKLRDISNQSSEVIRSDFLGDRPSIFVSTMLNDGKIVDGEQLMRVDSHKEWEFHLINTGTPRLGMEIGPVFRRYLNFRIQSGEASVSITNPLRMAPGGNKFQVLEVGFSTGKQESRKECSLSQYQKPIDQAISELIQSRYYEFPLKQKP